MEGMNLYPAVTLDPLLMKAGPKSRRAICCTGGRLMGQLIHCNVLIS